MQTDSSSNSDSWMNWNARDWFLNVTKLKNNFEDASKRRTSTTAVFTSRYSTRRYFCSLSDGIDILEQTVTAFARCIQYLDHNFVAILFQLNTSKADFAKWKKLNITAHILMSTLVVEVEKKIVMI